MAVVITVEQFAQDVHGILERVKAGEEFYVEEHGAQVALISSPGPGGKPIPAAKAPVKRYQDALDFTGSTDPERAPWD